MDPERIFFMRCEQVLVLAKSRDVMELMDLAGRLRQLLWDQHNLVDVVNKNRLKLHFHVGALIELPPSLGPPLYDVLGEAIDPETGPPQWLPQAVTLTANQLGGHSIAYVQGTRVTIKDVVKFASNVAGGIHFDPRPGPKYAGAMAIYKVLAVNGLPWLAYQIPPIARVVMRGLRPLMRDLIEP